MQVHATTRLSDQDSVALGMQQLRQSFAATTEELIGKRVSRYEVIRMALAKYNRDQNYVGEVFAVLHVLWAQVAPDYRTEFESMYIA